MFDSLKKAFSDVAKSIGERELKEKDIDGILSDLEISLLESDVATEVIDEIRSELKEKLVGTKVEKSKMAEFVRQSLVQIISGFFDSAGGVDLLGQIALKKNSPDPYIILFVGINGTGKTTTLAKIAHLLQQSRFSVVIAAADTFRAGAIEQIREHAKRMNLKLVAQNYGSDPAAVARDAVLHARSQKIDCVLIDTAGRMQTSKNLMEQISKISDVVKPDFKIFVGDSLAGNDTVSQAREFFEHVRFDASILSKGDADARGGAALSIVKVTSTPILYIGVGQEYPDLKPFSKEEFLDTVFGAGTQVHDAQPEGTPSVESEPEPLVTKETQERQETAEPEQHVRTEKPEAAAEPEPQAKEARPDAAESEPIRTEKQAAAEPEPQKEGDDPFEGIPTEDINEYVEAHDLPPPENDSEARKMAADIREWAAKRSKETNKTKKRSLFGRFKR